MTTPVLAKDAVNAKLNLNSLQVGNNGSDFQSQRVASSDRAYQQLQWVRHTQGGSKQVPQLLAIQN